MDERVLRVVLDMVSETLGGGRRVTTSTPLLELPACSSLTIAALVERLEEGLGREIAPELIVPETFATPLTIAAALADGDVG